MSVAYWRDPLDNINPYAPPECHGFAVPAREGKKRWWPRHLAITFSLFPVWYLIGGDDLCGIGRPIETALSVLGFLVLFGYAGICLFIGMLDLVAHAFRTGVTVLVRDRR